MNSCIHAPGSKADSYYDSMSIKNKKYKTIGDLKQAGIISIIQTTTRMDKYPERDYLDKWLYDTHYSKKEMWGNLTERIKNISNKICYREIIKRCFNDVDILSNNISKQLLSKPTVDYITELHSISPSTVGSFIDYLMRRIISEITGKEFRDRRSERIISESCYEIKHVCKPMINYNDKTDIELKTILINMGKNIKEKFSDSDKEFAIRSLSNDTNKPCKYHVKCRTVHSDGPGEWIGFKLPKCQTLCYQKSRNTFEYKTEHIIEDIFITSLFHGEAFGQVPKQEHVNEIYEKLTTNHSINDILIKPLTEMCKEIIKDKSDILLNPDCGSKLYGDVSSIPSDADLVVDDTLIDIKCTNKSHPISEIMQLLGYSSLMILNKHRKNINKIAIINILHGNITTYDIDFLNKDNCINYIKVLKNENLSV